MSNKINQLIKHQTGLKSFIGNQFLWHQKSFNGKILYEMGITAQFGLQHKAAFN
jgi:hypothetical protein